MKFTATDKKTTVDRLKVKVKFGKPVYGQSWLKSRPELETR